MNAAGNDVTPDFHDYLRPLLGADVDRGGAAARRQGREGGCAHGRCDLSAWERNINGSLRRNFQKKMISHY